MAGYFGNEPTCRRCDYPRRLHHLLGVDHDYDERSQENAPGPGATGAEGNESNPQETGDSDMQSTDAISYVVRLIVAGVQQTVAHTDTFSGARALINADVARRFGWDAIEYTVTTGDYVRMTTTVGLEVEYQILRHNQPVPEDEPTADDGTDEKILASLDPDGGFVKISETAIGDALTVIYDRYYSSTPGTPPEDCVLFEPASCGSLTSGSITPDQIPALIDTLTEIHRTWRENGGAL